MAKNREEIERIAPMKTRLIPVLFLLAACATVPYTERKQFSLVDRGQMANLGEEAYAEVQKQNPPSHDLKGQAMIAEVGRRIAAVADEPDFKWEFKLLEGKEVNAFCLPGGKVAFYEGIMPVCIDEAGIAVVMGHEVAHAIANHAGERMSQGLGAQLVGELLNAGLHNATPENRARTMQLFGLGAQVGLILPFSRKHESEADKIGLILMAKAGYDPRTAVAFWERMAASGGARPPEFLSTHPSGETRIAQIKSWLPEVMQYYNASLTKD
jgi:metalloendopeptidase OMA1, mitochondrial